MDAFAHLSVLLSIILGLGIAELLSRFGGLIEHRRTSSLYGPSLSWAFVLLIGQIQISPLLFSPWPEGTVTVS